MVIEAKASKTTVRKALARTITWKSPAPIGCPDSTIVLQSIEGARVTGRPANVNGASSAASVEEKASIAKAVILAEWGERA